MKKIISLMLILTMFFAFSSCTVNPERYSLATAANAMEVKHSDAKQEGYEEFINKLDAFAAKLTYEVYSDSNKQKREWTRLRLHSERHTAYTKPNPC